MDPFILIGVVGSIASIVSLAIAAPTIKSRLLHAMYGFVLTLVVGATFVYNQNWKEEIRKSHEREAALASEIESMKSIQSEAVRINQGISTIFSSNVGENRGFILASFSFLEKHRERFPESYEIAKKLITSGLKITESAGTTGSEGYYDEQKRMADGARTMKSLLKGIAGE